MKCAIHQKEIAFATHFSLCSIYTDYITIGECGVGDGGGGGNGVNENDGVMYVTATTESTTSKSYYTK